MPGITPSNTHTTRDGKHLIIGANGDAIFRRLMLAIGRVDLADDPQLGSNAGRDARAAEIYGVIDAWVGANDAETVLRIAAEAQVPSSPIYSVADMFRDPQFLARQMLEVAQLPDGKDFRIPGVIPKLSLTPGETRWLGPALGEHTETVLDRLGYSPDEIVRLRGDGAI
jgi:formyl-CoA transferase